MTRRFSSSLLLSLSVCFLLSSCVSERRFQEVALSTERLAEQQENLQEALDRYEETLEDHLGRLQNRLDDVNASLATLIDEQGRMSRQLEILSVVMEEQGFVTRGDLALAADANVSVRMPASVHLSTAQELLAKGEKALVENGYTDALLAFEEFLARFPERRDRWKGHLGLSKAFFAIGDITLAEASLMEAKESTTDETALAEIAGVFAKFSEE